MSGILLYAGQGETYRRRFRLFGAAFLAALRRRRFGAAFLAAFRRRFGAAFLAAFRRRFGAAFLAAFRRRFIFFYRGTTIRVLVMVDQPKHAKFFACSLIKIIEHM